MNLLMLLRLTWLRRWVLAFVFCATPMNVWAAIDNCIVLWDPVTTDSYNPPPIIEGYRVYIAHSPALFQYQWASVNVPPSATPQTTCRALGLHQTGMYEVSVTAYNGVLESPFTQIVQFFLEIRPLYLEVAGAPNLPFNGTTTPVTVWIAGETPTKVELSLDDYPPFATWPLDSFLTWSSDGQSLTGNWCTTSSCWGNVQGLHVLNVVATYSSGATATAEVALNVAD